MVQLQKHDTLLNPMQLNMVEYCFDLYLDENTVNCYELGCLANLIVSQMNIFSKIHK